MERSGRYRQISLTITLGPRRHRANLLTRIVRNGRRADHLVASRNLPDDMPVESVQDCLDMLAVALNTLTDHPTITWVEDPSASPEGIIGGQ